MGTIDLTSFENAINSLCDVINIYDSDKSNIYMRDSMIQRFEYTYSISLKIMKRYLKQSEISEDEINGMTFNDIIRRSNQYGILKSNLEVWDDYRQKRNMTSHTYNENVAKDVVAIIPAFKDEAKFILNKLKEKLA